MKILHVTESMATGVMDVLARMVQHQAALGHEVDVAFVPHPDGPPLDAIARLFTPASRLHVHGEATHSRARRTVELARLFRRMTRSSQWDIIHLHSTFAGIVGRVIPTCGTTIYSPHGYAFLRGDIAKWPARAYKLIESALASRAALTLSVSQAEAAEATAIGAQAHCVPNVLSRADVEQVLKTPTTRPRVINIGRWGPQKAPERFVRAAQELHEYADFRWIGPGETDSAGRWTTTGWLNQPAVWQELASASLVYFTSRWEGMPVGLMQAQAAGVPAVAIECVGVRDVIIDGVTGLIARDEESALALLHSFVRDEARLMRLTSQAFERRFRFSDENYGRDLVAAYGVAIAMARGGDA